MKIIIAILFIVLNIFVIPVGIILGAFSMDSPTSTPVNFFLVSILAIGIPNLLLFLLIHLIKKLIKIERK